jgi:hypothetical protein
VDPGHSRACLRTRAAPGLDCNAALRQGVFLGPFTGRSGRLANPAANLKRLLEGLMVARRMGGLPRPSVDADGQRDPGVFMAQDSRSGAKPPRGNRDVSVRSA